VFITVTAQNSKVTAGKHEEEINIMRQTLIATKHINIKKTCQ